ncbi:MAG: cation diffusion facilitator family transporter [Panacagrimonas sp.]
MNQHDAGHAHQHVRGPTHGHDGSDDHGHTHGPDHDHHHHHADASARRLKLALAITASVMLLEAVGGWWTNSLALIADAGHMLADAGSLLLAVLALAQAARPADAQHSYGHGRFPVLAAFVNGLLLLAVSAWIFIEAVLRLIAPEPVQGWTLAAIAMVGLLANLAAFGFLHGGHEHDLNRRGAAAHVLSDLLGSLAAVCAGLIIVFTGWMRADPLLSMFAALLIVRAGIRITRESAHVLLEGAPPNLDLRAIATALPAAVTGVSSVHHIHAWSITPGDNLMTLHAVLNPEADADQTLQAIQIWLLQTYRVGHVTVQLERASCDVSAYCGADERQ